MSNTGVVELRFPAHARYLVLARLGLAGVAQAASLDAETLTDLKLAITEACSNVVRHAYPGETDGDVCVRIELLTDRLAVQVTDRGLGFELSAVDGWRATAMREQGMGLSIIRSVTDEFEVESAVGGPGTTVRFVKSFAR